MKGSNPTVVLTKGPGLASLLDDHLRTYFASIKEAGATPNDTTAMKILSLIRSIDLQGGGPISVITSMAQERLHHGHQTTVVSMDAPDSYDPATLPFKWIGLGPSWGTYGYTPRLTPWLRSHAREFDAVILHGLWMWHGLGTWRTLRRTNVPYLIFCHGMLDPWFKRRYPLKHLKKWLYWSWAEYHVLRDAAAVCFTSEQERSLARESFRLYRANERVVGYGIASPPTENSKQKQAFLQAAPATANKRVLLFLSRIHEKKGCDLLLKAFAQELAKDPTWHLVMAGPDQEGWRSKLEIMAQQYGISERVSWPGMLTGDAKWGAFRVAEVFCLPSHQENFGVVVAEALACGCPVLISDQVNIFREVLSARAGFVEPDTTAGCAALLRRWQALPHSEAADMRARAIAAYHRHFHVGAAAASINAVISQVMRKKGA